MLNRKIRTTTFDPIFMISFAHVFAPQKVSLAKVRWNSKSYFCKPI